MRDQSDHDESAENREPAEPIKNADMNEPIEPIEHAEPIEPIDKIEPLEPIDSTEFSDQSDHRNLGILSGFMPHHPSFAHQAASEMNLRTQR